MRPFAWGEKLPAKHANQRQEGARTALIVLSCVNLLHYADRVMPSALKSLLERDLHLTDTETSLPNTGIFFVYLCTSVFFGWIADMRFVDRRVLLAASVVFRSVATGLAGVSDTFTEFLIFRSLTGVGEAALMATAYPMLADFYPIVERNMAFTVFALSAPLGGASGFVLGAILSSALSWHVAFFACGAPGLIVALLVLKLNDPSPGINDPSPAISDPKLGKEAAVQGTDGEPRSAFKDVRDIFGVPHWRVGVVGFVATTFAEGGLADWYATFLLRTVPGTTVDSVELAVGSCTLVGGIAGGVMGSEVAQRLSSSWHNAFLRVPALFMAVAAAFIALCMNITISQYLSYLFLFLGAFFFLTYTAPLNVVLYNSMPVHLRARAGAICVLFSHAFGDVISPPIIGAISDTTGSLRLGMQLCWITATMASLTWGLGSVFLPTLPLAVEDPPPEAVDAVAASPTLGSILFGEPAAGAAASGLLLEKKGGSIYGTSGA